MLTKYITKLQGINSVLTHTVGYGLIAVSSFYFVLPELSGVKTLTYLLIILPSALLLLLNPQSLKFLRHPTVWMFFALPIYLCLSNLWENSGTAVKPFSFFAKQVAFLLLAAFGIREALLKNKSLITQIFYCVFILGIIGAALSLLQHVFLHDIYWIRSESRLLMGFAFNDSNKTASLHAIHLCLAYYLYTQTPQPSGFKIALFATAILLDVLVIYYSCAKVPLLIALLPAILLMLRVKMISARIVLAAVAASSAVTMLFFPDSISQLWLDRSIQVRLSLLHDAAIQGSEHLFFGSGLLYKWKTLGQLHTHNFILDIFRFGGLLGVALSALHIAVVTFCYAQTRHKKHSGFVYGWFLLGVVFLLFYGQQPLTRPGGYIWIFYWIPAILVVTSYSISQLETKPTIKSQAE